MERRVTPLGVDLALVKTGWADLYNKDAGLIRTDLASTGKPKGIERRRYIADQLEERVWLAASPLRVTDLTDPPLDQVLVVIENHVVDIVAKSTAIGLGQLHAVVLDTLAPLRCPVAYVAPKSLKKFLAGSGKADKDAMVAAARACGYQGHQEDEADAWGLALIGHHLLGGQDHLTAHRASCLAAVEWVVPMAEAA